MRVIFGDWAPDSPDLENTCLDAKNVIPTVKQYGPILALASITNALASAPLAGITSSIISGTTNTYVGTATALYRMTAPTWANVSPVGLNATTAWSFCQFDKFVLAASYSNLVVSVSIPTTNLFATLANSPQAQCIATVRDFVMAGYINDPIDGEKPWRVRWSAIDNSQDWPLAGTNDAYAKQSDQQDLRAEDGNIQCIIGTEYALIFQEKAITRGSYVGSPLVFQFDRIDSTRGAISPGAVVNIGRVCYFLARDGFFANDGSGESVSIGNGKVDKWMLDQLADGTLTQIRGGANPREKFIFWTFAAGGSPTPNKIIIYNYALSRWSYAEIAMSIPITSRTAGYTLDNIDAFGTLETIQPNFDDAFWGAGGQFSAAFTTDYKLASFSGAALEASIDTGEFGLEGRRGYLTGVRPLIQGSNAATVKIGNRELMGSTASWTAARAITPSTGSADFRSTGFYFRARVTIAGGFDGAIGIDAVVVDDDSGR